MTKQIKTLGLVLLVSVISCSSKPDNIEVVKPFDINKYLGKWYEIARMDLRFERNLNNTTAQYTLNNDGTIKVVNSGYNYVTKQNKQAIGKAKLVGLNDEAKLKVSFFGPFYSAYNVIAIDAQYKYALVMGSSSKYLWILSREKTIPATIKEQYVKIAASYGANTDAFIWVEHNN